MDDYYFVFTLVKKLFYQGTSTLSYPYLVEGHHGSVPYYLDRTYMRCAGLSLDILQLSKFLPYVKEIVPSWHWYKTNNWTHAIFRNFEEMVN